MGQREHVPRAETMQKLHAEPTTIEIQKGESMSEPRIQMMVGRGFPKAMCKAKRVSPRGLEPLISAVRGRLRYVANVPRCSKNALSKPDLHLLRFPLLLRVYRGHCRISVKV